MCRETGDLFAGCSFDGKGRGIKGFVVLDWCCVDMELDREDGVYVGNMSSRG